MTWHLNVVALTFEESGLYMYVLAIKLPHGIFEELGQDVIQRQRDEREASCHVSVNPHPGRVTVLVITQTSGGREKQMKI